MHVGTAYRLSEFLVWTRKDIYLLIVLGIVPVVLYQVAGLQWLGIPWAAVAVLGTATAFIVGFKNVQTYSRTWEARQIWGEIVGCSRAWGAMCRDFVNDPEKAKALILRHLGWLTALRYQLREPRAWETAYEGANAEYQKGRYSVPERETAMEQALAKYLSSDELKGVLQTSNRATQILALQSRVTKDLYANQEIVVLQLVDMQRSLRDLHLQQARSERIKDFPFPRQFATVCAFFVMLFCVLLPFGLLKEFDKLNEGVDGLMRGHMVWLVVPVSMVISWMFTSLDRVGESTENPFEGGANDVPISLLCRSIEIDLREMLGETELPPALQPRNNIVL
jgi:putative membrane protein